MYHGQIAFKNTWFRLVRRMVRDYKFRNSAPEETMSMWANVRRGEKANISPFKGKADYQFDSSLPYEIAVMNETATKLFQQVPEGIERYDELKQVLPVGPPKAGEAGCSPRSSFPHFSSVQFSHSVVSNSLRPHELQHARLSCSSLSPRVCSNSCPSSQLCHPTISSSVVPFSSCPHSFSVSGCFSMSRLYASGGQNIGDSASASHLPMNIQDLN